MRTVIAWAGVYMQVAIGVWKLAVAQRRATAG